MSDVLFPGDSYSTPPGRATFFASRFPSLFFLWKVLGIIRHDGNLAVAGKYGGPEWAEGSLCTLRALERCGVVVHVSGMENIDRADGPCVFIANHMSTLETFVLPVFIQPRRDVTFVVKESLLKYPWFGPVLGMRNPVVVGRKNARADLTAVLDGGADRLRKGTSLIVFPQSTRSLSLDPALFNSIGVKLAKRANVPIVPLALRTDAWGMGALIKDLGRISPALPVHFAFGEPMTVSGGGKAEHAAICAFIAERLREWCPPASV
jgi:1-acyl-sn-glycerol-3-phosphate acyltransferase